MPQTASPACRRRTTCRLCGGKSLENVFSLTPTPPANAFVGAEALHRVQDAFPLDLHFCRGCAHLQLLDVVDPEILFENYVYVSGTSPVFVDHFKSYAASVVAATTPAAQSLVVDIGSNDGTLLRFFKQAGLRVLGVDPAKKIAAAATASGIETLPLFFTQALARTIRAERGAAAVVTGNNVFAHADDLRDILAGVRALLSPEGVFVFEVSYLADVYAKTLFDTIYHEHLAYHSVKPLRAFFSANGMELIDARRVDTHGGSLRGMARLSGGSRKIGGSVAELIALEEKIGLDRPETFRGFAAKIDDLKSSLQRLLRKIKNEGKTIAAFGAPAKATTLMYHFGLGRELIDFIVDDSPLKQNLYSPGLHLPVVPSSHIYEKKPDYLLILAWNFADSIIAKHAAFRRAGGRFILPLPEVQTL